MVHPSRFSQIASVAILGLMSTCISAQAQVFSPPPPVLVSKNAADFSITPQMGVDAAGNIYMVWEDDSNTTPFPQIILFSRSTDGGMTFSAPKPLSNPLGFATNPRICVDSLGGINVVWQDNATTGGNYDVFFSRSTDGVTFSNPVNLSSANDPEDSTSPQVATDASGNINVVWEGDNINLGVFFSRSTNGGASFSTPTNLAQSSTGSFGPQIAVGADGSINVVWQNNLNLPSGAVQSVVYFSRSVDNGTSFSTPPTNISNDSGNSSSPQIALDSSGNINITWVDDSSGHFAIMFRRSDKSASFATAAINVSNNPPSPTPGDCDLPQIGVDAGGNIELVWQHNTPTVFNHQIFSARSIDGGTSFSIPQNRSIDLGEATNPWLTMDASGGINLGWLDTTPTPGKAQIFFARSTDAGANFSTQPLSSDSGPSSGVQIAADKNGDLDVVWSDGSSGVDQILFRRYTNPQVVNQPPVANAGSDQTLECAGPGGTPAKLDGTGSSDPDGDALSFVWTDETGKQMGTTAIALVTVAMGTHTFTLTVTDAGGLTAPPATTHVTVRDTMAPKLSVSLSPSYLTVSNHKLDQITATVTVSDVCDASPTVQLVSITSNEPIDADDVEAVGGGPVPFGTDVRSFLLGAEHSRAGAARIYTVTYMAKDASGNTTVATVQVGVGDPSATGKHKKHRKHNRR